MRSLSSSDIYRFRAPGIGTDALPAAQSEAPASLSDDLKLFATFWLGGLVFFGTFLA
jgi:hypothetical protein